MSNEKNETKPKPAKTPEPNTIFSGKREQWNKTTNKVETVSREAPGFIIDGANKIRLPDAETQAKGFSLEVAEQTAVMNLLAGDYKTVKKLSE